MIVSMTAIVKSFTTITNSDHSFWRRNQMRLSNVQLLYTVGPTDENLSEETEGLQYCSFKVVSTWQLLWLQTEPSEKDESLLHSYTGMVLQY